MKQVRFFTFLFAIILLLVGCTSDDLSSQQTIASSEHPIDATSSLRVHYIDVGQADATLLQLKEGNDQMTLLIDTGDWNRQDVVAYLEKENIKEIDLIIITHPHADHIGQLSQIIENFNVGEVWMNGDVSNSEVFAGALQAIEAGGVDYYEPIAGETFDVGDLTIDVIHPNDLSLDTNNNSISMRMQYHDISFLFTGDAEVAAEEKMLASGVKLQADILHLGHHGSNTSSTESFLQAVNAKTAIYSAGVNNSYGHPDQEIIERVQHYGMDLYGTNVHGTIVIETDGKKYRTITEQENNLSTPPAGKTCIDINTATSESLQDIIHIGEKTAATIIELRPYDSVESLLEVNGIGPERLKAIQEQNLACVGG